MRSNRERENMAKNYSKTQILQAIKGSGGVIDFVAMRLGCGWECARNYINKYPDAAAALDEEKCKLNSLAYNKFQEAIKKGERWALERMLDTTGRRNGHGLVNHQQIDHTSNGEKLQTIEVVFVDPEDKK